MITLPTDAIKASVENVITSLGQIFTVRTIVSKGTFNPLTGQYDNRVVSDRQMRGVDVGKEQRWLNGILVASEGYVIYFFDDGLGEIPQSALVLMGSEEIGIQSVDEYKIAGERLATRVTLAG